MSLDFIVEVWDALRSHIDMNDRGDAADSLINLLIENNHEADDIKDAFKGDKDISVALKDYASQHNMEEDYEDYEEDDDQDEWD